MTNKLSYDSGTMRIRFDVALGSTKLSHVNAYLLLDGKQVGAALTPEKHGLSVTIPKGVIQNFLPKTGGYHLQIKLAAWFQNEGDSTAIGKITDGFIYEYRSGAGDLSTLPDTPENATRRNIENAILATIAPNFSLEGDSSEWRWVIASDQHTGHDFHAADLNWGTGDNDYGKEVRATADGTIDTIAENYGSVKLSHKVFVDGQEKTWYSTNLHMPVYKTDRLASNGNAIYEMRKADGSVAMEIYVGMELRAGDAYGLVAGRGTGTNDHAFTAHSHQTFSADGTLIDPRKLMSAWGITNIKASDLNDPLREWSVYWNEFVKGWFNTENNLFYDRSAQVTGSNVAGSWIAWHADSNQRSAVRWDTDNNAWFQWDIASNNWKKDVLGRKLKWNGTLFLAQ